MTDETDIMALLALADLSIAKGDYERSLLLFKSALNQAEKTNHGDLKQRLDIMMKLAEVNHITGEWVDALMYLDNVFQSASEKNYVGMMGEALINSGTILSKKGKWDIAQRKFEQVISLIGSRGQQPLVARAYIGIGVISWRKGQPDEAIQLAKKALAMAEKIESDELIGSAQALLASVAFDVGDYSLSLTNNDKALHHYRKTGNILEVARILNNTGETHKALGDYPKAIDFFNEGVKITSGKGVRRSMGYLLTNIAECYIRQEKNIEARFFATKAGDTIEGIQDEYLQAMVKFVWALIHEYEHELGKASENYMSALLKMFSLGIPFDSGMIQLAYSGCLLKQNKKDEAVIHLNDAVASFKKAGSRSMTERAENELEKITK